MPYENEHSKHRAITDLVKNEGVKNFMSSMKVITRTKANFEKVDDHMFLKPEEVETIHNEMRLKSVFAFDGSKTQIAIDTGFPGAEIGIIKVSQTFIDLFKMKEYEKEAFPHPSKYEEIFMTQNFELTVPGFNVCSELYEDPKDFFRYALYEYLKANHNTFIDLLCKKMEIDFQPKTFLDTYKELLFKRTDHASCTHPCDFCCSNSRSTEYLLSLEEFKIDNFETTNQENVNIIKCSCKHNPKDLFVTDLLHFHEGYSYTGSNEGLYTQVMSFIEKLIFMNLVQNLKSIFSEWEENPFFKDCAFILDGPLAIYNYASWFSKSMANEFIDISENEDMLIIGVEKSGHFVEHLKNLDGVESPEDKPLSPGFLFFLNDLYIKRYIKYTTSPIVYGQNNYFGKKIFYKNYEDQLFVINLAYNSLEDRDNNINSRNETFYRVTQQRLRDLVWLFENYSSSRFANALSFVSMAHENASISSNYFSKRIIDDFVKSSMSFNNGNT